MGSTDYLNSARRAAIVFGMLALAALGAAGHRLARNAWGAAPVALALSENRQSEAACGRSCPSGRVAWLDAGEGAAR